jgi:hypothetical protein
MLCVQHGKHIDSYFQRCILSFVSSDTCTLLFGYQIISTCKRFPFMGALPLILSVVVVDGWTNPARPVSLSRQLPLWSKILPNAYMLNNFEQFMRCKLNVNRTMMYIIKNKGLCWHAGTFLSTWISKLTRWRVFSFTENPETSLTSTIAMFETFSLSHLK